MQIELLPKNSKKSKKSAKRAKIISHCIKQGHKNCFECDNQTVPFEQSFKTELDPNRIEKSISFRFTCNSSCTSMFEQSQLKFSIVDENDLVLCDDFKPFRKDEKDLVKRENRKDIK